MTLSFEELAVFRRQVVMVDGGFDPLHAGHLEYFNRAHAIGRPLLCCVAPDRYVSTKHPVLLPEDQRVQVVDALWMITYTHLNQTSTEAVLEQLEPLVYVKGMDWRGRLPESQVRICDRLGTLIVYVETFRESSTRLLQAAGVRCGSPTSDTP